MLRFLQTTFIWHEDIKSNILRPFTFMPLLFGMRTLQNDIVHAPPEVELSLTARPYLCNLNFNGVRISCSDKGHSS